MERGGPQPGRVDPGGSEPLRNTFLQFGRGSLVERQQQDAVRGSEPAGDGVGGPGNHHRGLSGSGGGEHLDPVVEAHHRSCLLVGERALLDCVEERPSGRELDGHDLFISLCDQGLQVGVQEANGFELILGERRLTPSSTDTVKQVRFRMGREQRVNGLSRDPPLLGGRHGEVVSGGGMPCGRVSDRRCQNKPLERPFQGRGFGRRHATKVGS